jgi:hypothetical protein
MKNKTMTDNRPLMTFVTIAVLAAVLLAACGTGQAVPAGSPDEVAHRLDTTIFVEAE